MQFQMGYGPIVDEGDPYYSAVWTGWQYADAAFANNLVSISMSQIVKLQAAHSKILFQYLINTSCLNFSSLKFIYSKKATKFCEISTIDLTGTKGKLYYQLHISQTWSPIFFTFNSNLWKFSCQLLSSARKTVCQTGQNERTIFGLFTMQRATFATFRITIKVLL